MRRELRAKEAGEIQGMFGRIAHRYDMLNHLLSLGRDRAWRRTLARKAASFNPKRVVDVCTGTGDLALEIASRLPPGVEVLGCDFCLPMLAVASAKTGNITVPLLAADALQLPFPDHTADVVSVAFGIRNFSDLDRGLAELVRVLRPGGRVLILEFSRPVGPMGPLMRWWASVVPPRVGAWISGDREAYAYLPDSVSRFPAGEEMLGRLRLAGLKETSFRLLTSGVASLYEGSRE